MKSFLEEVIEEVSHKYGSLEDIVFVLPSKRAGTFLRNSIAKTTTRASFAPEIYSIETFIEKMADLGYANNTEQLFQLYECYLKTVHEEPENFYAFSKWGQTLLQDFNEIDRYLVDPKAIFSHLSAIKEINHWSLQEGKTQMITDYLQFWNNLPELYDAFNSSLLKKGLGHQGLVYRKATEQLKSYLTAHSKAIHIFIGFNALNTAESRIIQEILENSTSEIYWDIDPYFLEDQIHDAGHFIRQHMKTWNYFTNKPVQGVKENYLEKKDIKIVGLPKSVSQAKYVGHLLDKIHAENQNHLKNTAVVLGDETLLNPIMNSVPEKIEGINITMGYPLHNSPLAGFFTQFFDLYLNRDQQGWYFQDLLSFLSHPYTKIYLTRNGTDGGYILSEAIKSKNWSYVNKEKIVSVMPPAITNIHHLFFSEDKSIRDFLETCSTVITGLKEPFKLGGQDLGMEYLYRFHELFNQLNDLTRQYPFISDLRSLSGLYRELLSSETLDFRGEPLKGLQIMGMLESRNLDFETVILTSVNEGILPSGKSNNSFLPFDLKIAFGLPTYKEKDAVYTYHFYRLLQRAKQVYIIYNTEPDVLEGGEKSRLIAQMLTDKNRSADITELTAAPEISPSIKKPCTIQKEGLLMEKIKALAEKGFSPSSLTNYIRNPIDFYKRSILKIDDVNEVEENVAANTFGTIVHDSLEELYTPFIGEILTKEGLDSMLPQINHVVKSHFAKSYADGDISRGKNLIAYEVVIQYIKNFIKAELGEIQNHDIKILGLEEGWNTTVEIEGLDYPVVLKGKLDRIDERDGMLRIIDYKTGKVSSTDVEVYDWQELITNYDFSKAFQLLCYAYMYHSKKPIQQLEAGIISFKNLKDGLLLFATKSKKGDRNKDTLITPETIALFHSALQTLILEICNPDIPFMEKEV
ncbi:PD-(D/E)XK nuclease family protein [Sediminicola sp. 1XM1-17]|uniref:PD-(D/E)XK nuclease family protein n=1 Tax=Sediminicola sp. 1XM1-17 TaxID=3127702 RepID=UPI003077E05A